jgi:hypothetical protein
MVKLTLWSVLAITAVSLPAWSAETAMRFSAKGFQVYTCGQANGGYAWTLKAPDAVLTGPKDMGPVKHFAGPTWQAKDGSSVVGEAVATSAAPQKGSIPWLVLRAKSHSGQGLLSDVGFIARVETRGGVAPNTGCDQAHSGAEKRVPYTASYLMFPTASPK